MTTDPIIITIIITKMSENKRPQSEGDSFQWFCLFVDRNSVKKRRFLRA
jgi:hypothetical protein